MNSVFSQLGLNTALDYGKYQAIKGDKGDKGDYVDFLLHYDNIKAEEGDDSWMSSLFGVDDMMGSLPPEAIAMMDSAKSVGLLGDGKKEDGSALMVDAQVSALKLQLIEAFKQRYEDTEKNEEVKNIKIAALYAQAQSVKIPSRFL
jgi:uncharacterized protein YdbL (DUF1318 family)